MTTELGTSPMDLALSFRRGGSRAAATVRTIAPEAFNNRARTPRKPPPERVVRAVQPGTHVLCEQPVAVAVEQQCNRMIVSAHDAGSRRAQVRTLPFGYSWSVRTQTIQVWGDGKEGDGAGKQVHPHASPAW